jgi:hypothetical protein
MSHKKHRGHPVLGSTTGRQVQNQKLKNMSICEVSGCEEERWLF